MRAPTVSVIIPTLGRWNLLRPTLEAVLSQQDVELEVVIIDGRRDKQRTAEVLGRRDERVRIFSLPESSVAAKRNQGIENARGEWVAFLDDDDLWAPLKLAHQLELDGEFVFCGCIVVDERWRERALLLPPENGGGLYQQLLRANLVPAGPSNVLVRAELLQRVGGFDERFSILDDWDMWIRLAREARARTSSEVLVAQREHSGSEGHRRPEDVLTEAQLLAEKHGSAATLDREALLRWVIGSHRRAGRRVAAARGYLDLVRLSREPRDVLRAVGVLLGERAMSLGQRRDSHPPQVAWLRDWRRQRGIEDE
jgi:glycosyltransferase involved in cell wall biosynthesis